MIVLFLMIAAWLGICIGRWLWARIPAARRRMARDGAGYAVLSAFAILFVGPFVWMLSTSLKTDTQVLSAETRWLPTVPTVRVQKQDENGTAQDVYQPIMQAPAFKGSGAGEAVVTKENDNGTSDIQSVMNGHLTHTATVPNAALRPVSRFAPQWHNYPDALRSFPFVRYTLNTLLICALTVLGTVLSAALPAYGFARLRWKGREALFFLLIATIMLPSQVTMLPVFLIFRALHWTGTILPLVVPSFFGSAFYIFLLRQFFLTIPQELSDAARIDGCGEIGILWRILAPIARPALATVALLSFTSAWMDFTGPLIYLHDERTYTLAIGLLAFLGRHGGEWSLLMAASMVMTVPMLVLFFFAQRTYIQGIALTGLKG